MTYNVFSGTLNPTQSINCMVYFAHILQCLTDSSMHLPQHLQYLCLHCWLPDGLDSGTCCLQSVQFCCWIRL